MRSVLPSQEVTDEYIGEDVIKIEQGSKDIAQGPVWHDRKARWIALAEKMEETERGQRPASPRDPARTNIPVSEPWVDRKRKNVKTIEEEKFAQEKEDPALVSDKQKALAILSEEDREKYYFALV